MGVASSEAMLKRSSQSQEAAGMHRTDAVLGAGTGGTMRGAGASEEHAVLDATATDGATDCGGEPRSTPGADGRGSDSDDDAGMGMAPAVVAVALR